MVGREGQRANELRGGAFRREDAAQRAGYLPGEVGKDLVVDTRKEAGV